jgi:hypothetical protein
MVPSSPIRLHFLAFYFLASEDGTSSSSSSSSEGSTPPVGSSSNPLTKVKMQEEKMKQGATQQVTHEKYWLYLDEPKPVQG